MSNELKEFKDGGKRLGRLLWTGGRKRKVATVIVGAFVALVVISGIVGDQGKDNKGGTALPPAADAEPTNTAEATATARATDTPEPTNMAEATAAARATDTPDPGRCSWMQSIFQNRERGSCGLSTSSALRETMRNE